MKETEIHWQKTLNDGNTTEGNAENTDEDDFAITNEMSFHLGLPSPEPLDLRGGNFSENLKKFKQKYKNYEIATGINMEESANRVAANSHLQRCY